MSRRTREEAATAVATREESEREKLNRQLADIKAEIKALRQERNREQELTDLRREIETLKIEKGRLVEDNEKELREVTHKTGLLKIQQQHEVEHAKRMAQLEVREGNLEAERVRFEKDMEFQREHMEAEVDRFVGIAQSLMERLPVIEVGLGGNVEAAGARSAADARRTAGRKPAGG